jgi:PAS domain S-box-containing protein
MISVIYVDDEPGLLELGKLFLEKDGRFSVETVTSARQALDILRSRHFDAIISDYQMPGMDGIALLKEARSSGITLPFIIFTGRGREEIVIQALNEGADFYLQKGGEPVSQFMELAHKVEKAVMQRRAETSIRDHERREADIINFLPDATFAIDSRGNVIAWNRAMERMTGVRSADILGKDNYEYSVPFYHERRPILIDLVLHDDPATAGRYPFIKREGRTLFSEITIPHFNDGRGAALWFTASPLYDMQGTIIGAIESIREITERKRAERALHESERRFRELSDLLPQVVFEADVHGMLTYANRIAFDLFGYSEDEVGRGFCILQTLAPFERGRAEANIRKLLERGPTQSEADDYLAIKKDGTTFPVTVYSSPVIVNGKTAGLRGVVVDNSERRRTDEALQQSEVRFRSLIQNASDMIRILDRDGKIVYESPSTVAIMGYPAGENTGKDPFEFVHPDDIERVQADLREVYDRTNPGTPTEFRARKADGTYIWVDTIATNMLDVPAVNGIVVTTRPIDQRKRMEEAIRESEELYRTVFETTGTATVLIENDATISLANSEFVRLSGFLKEEIEGKKKWTEFVVKEDLNRMLDQHRLRRTDPGLALKHYEFRFLSRSGAIHDIYLTIDVIPGTERSVASLLDITERKRGEEDLITANREYTGLLNQIQDIYYRSDAEGRVVRASRSWASLLGYGDISECLGRSIAGEFYFNPGDREKFLEIINRDGKVTDYEVWLKKKDGTPVLVSTSSHLYHDSAGHVLGVEGTFRDVTVRKLHETILKTQLALGLALQNVRDLKGALDLCLKAAVDIAGMDAGGIYLVDERSGSIDLVVSRNLGEAFIAGVSHYPAGSDNARIVLAGKPLYVQFSTTGVVHTPEQDKENLKAVAIIPIWHGGRVIASLNITSHTLDEVPEHSRIALETIATQIGAAIERIRSEVALAESEERYRNVVEDQTELISRFRPDGMHVFVNDAYCRYFGLERGELLGHRFRPEIPPEDRERVAQFFASLTPVHPVDVIEHRIVMPDGSVRWQRWSDRAIFDESGVLKEYQSVGRDITTRRETEDALRESAARLRTIMQAVQTGIVIIDAETHRILDINGKALALIGGTEEKVVGAACHRFICPAEEGKCPITDIHQTLDASERILVTCSGKRIPILKTVVPAVIGGKAVLIESFDDITEQKRVETALKESEEKYRSLSEASGDLIFVIDSADRVTYVNNSAAGMLMLRVQDVIGRERSSLFPAEVSERQGHAIRKVFETGNRSRSTGQLQFDGKVLWFDHSLIPIRDAEGTVTHVLGISRDITESKSVEETLRIRTDELDYRNQILRTLLDIVPIGIFMVEAPSGKPIIANREATRLLGRETLPDVTEETFSEMYEAYIAGTAERYPAEKIPLIRGIHGESSYVDDAMIVRPDGTHIQLEIFGTPIRDRSGRVIASLVSFLDITERKQAEETIKSLAQFPEENPWPVLRIGGNGLLLYVNNPGREWLSAMQVQPGESQAPDILSLVADTIRLGGVVRRELQDAAGRYYLVTATQPKGETYVNFYISDITERKQAERTILETNKKINLLTSITRHDVANQVTALKGFAQIALMKRPDPLVADLLGKIDNAGSMIARQIEFTRTYEELGLHAPGWHKVSEILARQKTDGITLSCTCGAEIYADPMVEKVFFNLIDNAIRHGESVTEIHVGCEQTPEGLTIFVADNGVGVPIKDKQKIFDKGYGKNTGFGLFLAREILAITRIAISEVGMYGRGARFEMYVPEGAYRFR